MENRKKLLKSQEDKALFGVCGGIAEYFDVDSLIVRLLFVLFTVMYGVGVLFYVIAALIIPNETAVRRPASDSTEYVATDGTVYQNRAAMLEGQEPLRVDMQKNTVPKKANGNTRSSSKTLGFIMLTIGILILVRMFIPQIDMRMIVAGCLIVAGLSFIMKKS